LCNVFSFVSYCVLTHIVPILYMWLYLTHIVPILYMWLYLTFHQIHLFVFLFQLYIMTMFLSYCGGRRMGDGVGETGLGRLTTFSFSYLLPFSISICNFPFYYCLYTPVWGAVVTCCVQSHLGLGIASVSFSTAQFKQQRAGRRFLGCGKHRVAIPTKSDLLSGVLEASPSSVCKNILRRIAVVVTPNVSPEVITSIT
jgi:hypothetical protein